MSNTVYGETLTEAEISAVSGGESILDDLMERFPFGEWFGGAFWPNGVPDNIRNMFP